MSQTSLAVMPMQKETLSNAEIKFCIGRYPLLLANTSLKKYLDEDKGNKDKDKIDSLMATISVIQKNCPHENKTWFEIGKACKVEDKKCGNCGKFI
ncbi:MAG: hypothetical protein KBD12_01820 [Candidatus Pacebacteria bacterium]|nr:hypothetical protein [Candidatus Paceibacterota bacterium]